jgi:LuxR family maltose regulon positive regulatory protein
MPSNLLETKLHKPTSAPRRVPRPHLIRRLDEGLASGRRITLVSAPAGFGKSTCVSEWVSSLDRAVSWLSLDPEDDDPVRFFTYLLAALQKIDPSLGKEIEGILRAGQLPPTEIISTTLINNIQACPTRFVLVLDDFQVIQDRVILQVMEKLVSNIPDTLHLVLLTREDPALPLARLRAHNRMTEIRAGELRFSRDEAGLFLNELMGLCLSQADVTMLDERTEGWIVGLQLAGLSVRDRPEPSSFISSLSGSHRYILSYLIAEVLSRQPEEIQQFLLQTSILDSMSGDLCDAVTGRSDSGALLEQLCNANLFLVPLDDEQRWYRYHRLFADLLRDRQKTLQKDRTAGLHRLASSWYQQAGLPGEAVRHALAAEDYPAAVSLIESHAVAMLVQGYAKTVEGWLNAIPPELRFQSPRTNMAFIWMHLLRGTYAQAYPFVEKLQVIFSGAQISPADPSVEAEWLTIQSYLLVVQGKTAEGLDLARRALEIVPEEDAYVRSLAYNGLATAYYSMNDYAHTVEACQKAVQYGRATANFNSELLGISVLLQIALQHGQYHFAFETASEGISRVENVGSHSPISAVVYGALGQVYYQWNQVDQAQGYFQRSLQLSVLGGYSDVEIYERIILSRLLQIAGDLEGSTRQIQAAVEQMKVVAPAWVRPEVVSQQVRIDLAQGRLLAAEAALKGEGIASPEEYAIPNLAPDRVINHTEGLLYNTVLRFLLYQAVARQEPAGFRHAIELADQIFYGALQGQFLPVALEALLLRAQLHAALGDDPASLADVARALELAQPEGFISAFVEEGLPIARALAALLKQSGHDLIRSEYIQSILAAFSRLLPPGPLPAQQPGTDRSVQAEPPASGEPAALIEPLSQREQEVLKLICEGCSNQAIAGRLVLSLHTVKKHTSNIFSKLGVTSRTQAVARARQLKLL